MVAVVDKNMTTKGVLNPKEISKYVYDYIIIAIYNEKAVDEIKQELIDLGIDAERLIWVKPLLPGEYYYANGNGQGRGDIA